MAFFNFGKIYANTNFTIENSKNNLGVLSDHDKKLYFKILSLQNQAKWDKADKILTKLDNKMLEGYIQYEKLMHPNKYKASYEELVNWFKAYPDYPPVLRKRVYALLIKRMPKKEDKKLFKKPEFGKYLRGYGEDVKRNNLQQKNNKNKILIKSSISKYMELERHDELINYLNKNDLKNYYVHELIKKNIDRIYFKGDIKKSNELYKFYINKLSIKNPNFYFRAGINSYRLNKFNKAKEYFNKCKIYSNKSEEWDKASCLYWYAKLEKLKSKRKENFKQASFFPRTLYGQLAIEKLNMPDPFTWNASLLNKEEISAYSDLKKYKLFRRAIALTELSLYNYADLEIRNLYSKVEEAELKNIFYASEKLNLAAVLIRLGSKFYSSDNALYIRGLYPTPDWELKDGYHLDRAFLFALIRRESAFNIKAKSSKGARGLMQIMPRTASKLDNDYKLRYGNAYKLYSMQLNLKLGQKFLKRLIYNKTSSQSILDALIAYNAGITRLNKWKENLNINDPILFIESIPIKETRWFVKYILTDLWVYRDKFGQEKPSRKLLANDQWPIYKSLDYKYIRDAKLR